MTMLSRVADSLYWTSRYLERAEGTARALDVQLHLALDEAPRFAPLGWICMLNGLSRGELPPEISAEPRAATHALVFDCDHPSSIVRCIEQARDNARQIREELTVGMWEEINQLYLWLRELDIDGMWDEGPNRFLRRVRRAVRLFVSQANSSLARDQGWQFLRLGRFTERATRTIFLLDAHFGMKGTHQQENPTAEDFVAWAGLLRACNGYEAYCRQHTADLRPPRILEFLLLDREFPHSLHFAAREIEASVLAIAEWTGTPRPAPVRKVVGRLRSELSYATLDEVLAHDPSRYLRSLLVRCREVHDAAYERFIGYHGDSMIHSQLSEG